MKSNTPMGCEGLLPRWHQSILNDIKRLKLPQPDHAYGYSHHLLTATLKKAELKKFDKWLYGQTCMVDDDLGTIIYTHDVIRGLDLIRHAKPTYWD